MRRVAIVLALFGLAGAGAIEGPELRQLSAKLLKIENVRYNPANGGWRAIATITNSTGRRLAFPTYVACRLISETGETMAVIDRAFVLSEILPGETFSIELIEILEPRPKSVQHECGLQ